jgi:hypothetical protein
LLFDRGLLALQRALGEAVEKGYMCPLCLRIWTREALSLKLLTLDHVPPRSQGGRTVVLTCQECNNRSGHALEGHFEAVEDAVRFMTQTVRTARPFVLHWGEGLKVNVELLANESGIQVFGVPRQNRPGAIARWEADLANLEEQRHQVTGPDPTGTQNLPPGGRWGMTPFKGTNGTPKSRSTVKFQGNLGSPKGREPYGDGAPIVVRAGGSPVHGEAG